MITSHTSKASIVKAHAKEADVIPIRSRRKHRVLVSEQAASGQSPKETKAGLNIYAHPLREALRLEREREKGRRHGGEVGWIGFCNIIRGIVDW